MRPIFWGVIGFMMGLVGLAWAWSTVGIGVEPTPLGMVSGLVIAFLFYASIPLAVTAEVVRWRRRKSRISGL